MSQSTQARTSSRTTAPRSVTCQGTASNFAAVREPKAIDTSCWSSARTLTVNRPVLSMRGQLVELLPGQLSTSGGARGREVKEWQAGPAGGAEAPGAGENVQTGQQHARAG